MTLTAAENRRRLARLRSGPTTKDQVPPGVTGAEVLALRRLSPNSVAVDSNTEFQNGWQGRHHKVRFGRNA